MFIGHYGVSLAVKRWAPRLSLGWLFVAVQALDVLFAVFVLVGVEKVRIIPGFTAYNPYDLYFMPYTHGLVGALAWSIVVALIVRVRMGAEAAAWSAAGLFGLCVFSHWLLDLPMHTPDMPLLGNDSVKVGFGLWRHRELSLATELAAFGAGASIWLRGTGGFARAPLATTLFLLLLIVALIATPFMPDPKGPNAFAVTALIGYGALAAVAAAVDRLRGR
jgi:hypothetical protein